MNIRIVYNIKTGEIPLHKFLSNGTVEVYLNKSQKIDDYCVSLVDSNLVDFETFYIDLRKKNGKNNQKTH